MKSLSKAESSLKGHSAKGKIWRLADEVEIIAEVLSAAADDHLVASLLQMRGINSSELAEAFLSHEKYKPTSPLELPDVETAVRRIVKAITSGEHITVYGDYDVDGVTGTSVLLTVLRQLGASVDFYIPNRSEEGYGLNLKALSILASRHRTKLLITCDCGVSNFAEVNFGKSLGVETLILDHHSMPELLPPAVAIVHPKLLPEDHPLFHLPGVGVAYKVCEALLIDQGKPEKIPELLDFVTLGMIADLVPLIRENRYLVQLGLPILIKSARPGIQALLSQVRKSEDTDVVGFGLAPRINAVGRLADAKIAVELMTTDDPALAEEIARQLQTDNARRQEICEQIFIEADLMVKSKFDLENDKAIVIYKKGWHHGVVGIVASRLVEKYNRPVFIGEEDTREGMVRGSARSVGTVDLYAVLKENEQLLHKWGGHKMAAGFTVTADKAELLTRAIVATCNRLQSDELSLPVLEIDSRIASQSLSLNIVNSLAKLAPYGMSNRKPVFLAGPLRCLSERLLGKEGKHVRLNLLDEQSGTAFEGVMWNYQGKSPPTDSFVEVAFIPECNSFNGRDRLQLVLLDWRSASPNTDIEPIMSDLTEVSPVTPIAVAVANVKPTETEVESASSNRISEPALNGIERIATKQITWRDLREHKDSPTVLQKAVTKFGQDLAIFSESSTRHAGLTILDRIGLTPKSQLLFWQYPPSLKAFQEMIQKVSPSTIYLVGGASEEAPDISTFLKKVMAIIRFAVNNKDGQIEGERLASALGTTKMAAALAMTLLQKVGAVEWFAEDGLIYLELSGPPESAFDAHPEYKQLTDTLQQIQVFREWCSSASLKEIQLAVSPNQIRLEPAITNAPTVAAMPIRSSLSVPANMSSAQTSIKES